MGFSITWLQISTLRMALRVTVKNVKARRKKKRKMAQMMVMKEEKEKKETTA